MHVARLAPDEITADLEASLHTLRAEVIALCWLHGDDPQRPVAEIMDTLYAQVAAGKVRHLGCSNWLAERIREAQACAARQGVAALAYSSQAGGLCRRSSSDGFPPRAQGGRKPTRQRRTDRVPGEHRASMQESAELMRWVGDRPQGEDPRRRAARGPR